MGAPATPSGSRAPHEARSGLHPTGFDPSRVFEALQEAVYTIRNVARISERSKRFFRQDFSLEDFQVWAEHWVLAHPVVTALGALDDRDALLAADSQWPCTEDFDAVVHDLKRQINIANSECNRAEELSELLEDVFDFLGGCDGASELRDRILAASAIEERCPPAAQSERTGA